LNLESKGSALAVSPPELSGTGVVIISATSAVERASGDLDSGFGLFTKHLVKGITTGVGKRINSRTPDAFVRVSVNELFSFVKTKMAEEHAPQTPHIWNIESTGDFDFTEVRLKGARDAPTIEPARRWEIMQHEKRAVFDLVGPSYILDRAYHFLDWNASFDLLVARPLRLRRGTHVEQFLTRLSNWTDVFERANRVFLPGQDPLVDEERLEFPSAKYGKIVFHKMAAQIPSSSGASKAWSVQLNVLDVERQTDQLWRDMANDLRRHAIWSQYANSYDAIISPFTEYKKLVALLVSLVGDSVRCADLGCGTGNVTLELLSTDRRRIVQAVEKNDSMLEHLQAKLDSQPSLKRRAVLYKGDLTTVLREQNSDSLDACVTLNVLFALENPLEALMEVYRVLKRGGILSLSTSHKRTDIRALFNAIKTDLQRQRRFTNELNPIWLDAYYRNEDLEDQICRDTKEDIRKYLVDARFKIEEYRESEYVDCVVVYKAVK
jgi:SAM-dependent methyltransferase